MLTHAPLALLPSAVAIDMTAALTGRWRLARAGRVLWWTTAASGLVAGVAGMAASQEVKADEQSRDMMLLHGLGNLVLVLGAFGMATWRGRRPPSLLSGVLGLAAFGFAAYTGYLGGEMVYSRGVGVKGLTLKGEELDSLSPPLASREAPGRLLRDAVKGLGWLLGRARRVLTGREEISPGAYGVRAIEHRLEGGYGVPRSEGQPELRSW